MNCRTKRFTKGLSKYYSGGMLSYAKGGDFEQGYGDISEGKVGDTIIQGRNYVVDATPNKSYNNQKSVGLSEKGTGQYKQSPNNKLKNELDKWRSKIAADISSGMLPEQIKSKYAGNISISPSGNNLVTYNVTLPQFGSGAYAIYQSRTLNKQTPTPDNPPQQKLKTLPPNLETKPNFTFKRTSGGGDYVKVFDSLGTNVETLREEDAIKKYGLKVQSTSKRGTFGIGLQK